MRDVITQIKQHRTAALVLSVFVAFVFAMSTLFAPSRPSVAATTVGVPQSLGHVVVEAEKPKADSMDVLWLARCIYSETKQPKEQELVAWVVRNRVETAYRGKDTYREVVLDPWQFSAFNSNSPKRQHYTSLTPKSTAPGFRTALQIAERVANAPANSRPFT
ncbi:MAG TPA: cell wall hydrolase, partial [Rhodothermales bacterium]